MESSPYTPGAGHRPPVLAGRDGLLQAWRAGLNDVTVTGRQRAPDMVLTAPRGAGKTSTVLAFQDLSQQQGYEAVRLQAATGNASLVDSLLRRARSRAEEGTGPWVRAKRAFDRIASVNVNVAGFGGGLSTRDRQDAVQANRPSPEDIAEALALLAQEVRKDRRTGGVLLTIDELQAAAPADLTLIAAALQGLNTEYPDAAVMFAASGLPNTFDILKTAGVTHPDRLFKFHPIPLLLSREDARYAIVQAAREHGVSWDPVAADMIVQVSSGYPAHLQVFADQTWMAAQPGQVITAADVDLGIARAAQVLERESLGPRFDAMTPREREFLVGVAVNGGRATTAHLAITLGREQKSLSDLRDVLIREGDVYVPQRGDLALTVPVFGPYLVNNYERSRALATNKLLPLEEMQRNVEAIRTLDGNRALPEGRPPGLPRPDGPPGRSRAQLPGPGQAPDPPALLPPQPLLHDEPEL